MRKKCKVLSLLAIISIGILSCTKEMTAPVQISGRWVESQIRLDTLVFSYGNVVELRRAKPMSSLSLYSLAGAGLYKYSLKPDSISLSYLVSGNSVFKSFLFKIEDNKLYVHDFYHKNSAPNTQLIFERTN